MITTNQAKCCWLCHALMFTQPYWPCSNQNAKYSVHTLDCVGVFCLLSVLCSGLGAGGGCVARRSPGPARSNHPASGREQEAVSEPLCQRVAGHRGRPAETGRWVVCGSGSHLGFDGWVVGGFEMINKLGEYWHNKAYMVSAMKWEIHNEYSFFVNLIV